MNSNNTQTNPLKLWNQHGMTLLELMLVATILATLSGVVIFRLEKITHKSITQIALLEMTHLKKAILQFEQDTGRRIQTTRSPVDMEELFSRPTGSAEIPTWNPITKKGWRGPYLDKPGGVGYIDIGNGLESDGSGNPLNGDYLIDVPAIADVFERAPVSSLDNASKAHWYFNWITNGISSVGGDGETDTAQPAKGRPYALFDLNDSSKARIVSAGQNGIYENGGGDDLNLCIYRTAC